MKPIAILDRPHGESRRLLSSGAPVWLPVNPQEFHGPHLSLHNDGIVSAGLMRATHGRLAARHDWPLFVAPDLDVGVGAVPGAGSRSSSYGAVRSAVLAACDALADLGARAVVLMTFHGDPRHNLALQAGVERLRARGVRALAPMHLLLREIMSVDPSRFDAVVEPLDDPDDRLLARDGLPNDLHAGFGETSLTLHFAPETVSARHRELPPCPPWKPVRSIALAAAVARSAGRDTLALELDYAARGLGWFRLNPFPGYTGRPHLANPTSGRVLAEIITDTYADAVEAVLVEGAPPPEALYRWLSVTRPLPF